MFESKRAAMVVAGAVALVGCDPKCIAEWLNGHGQDGGGGGGHGGEEPCPPVSCPEGQYDAGGGVCRTKATSLSAGSLDACAILEGGGLKCWGEDSWHRLGYGGAHTNRGDGAGEMGNALPIVPLGAGLSAVQVAADTDVTCAILSSGGVKCWGYNGYGAVLGMPFPASTDQTVDTIPERTFSGGRSAVDIAAGTGTGYALLDDGSVVGIGSSIYTMDFGAGRSGVAFDRGSRYDWWHICLVLDTGEVACKGAAGGAMPGDFGQLGRPSSSDPFSMPAGGYPLVDLGTDVTATDVALGDDHSCALLAGGDVKCWGSNADGQLGQDDTQSRGLLATQMGDALVPVQLGRAATAITAGRHHSCALLDDGSVKCWGRNTTGQLGIGSTDNMGDVVGEMASLPTVDLGAGRTAVAIDAGTSTCALLDNGAVKCWGGNTYGELGQGDTAARGDAAGELGDSLPFVDLGV